MTRRQCRHPSFDRFVASRTVITIDAVKQMTFEMCGVCGAWLPLGKSNDAGCEFEIRAAALAAAWRPIGGVSKLITPDEYRGWAGWPYRQPTNTGELIGFLAAQIRNHERDLGDVNWAGQHMADRPLDARCIAEHSEDNNG